MKARDPVKVSSKSSPVMGKGVSSRGIWSGTLSFSLVAIPVHLVKAVEPGRVSFRMLHRKDYSPLKTRMFCPEEETIVPPDEIVRGYEIAHDSYILITDEELESVTPERSRTIEIIEFIDAKEIDPIYYDHPYYLVPSKGGEKAYCLLAEAMRQTHRAGLAKFVLSEREHLVVVKSTEGALAVITLHYGEEILPKESISAKEEVEDEEKNHIKKKIRKMMTDFDPEKYADERRKKILTILKSKVKEQAPVEAPEIEEEGRTGPADLVATLRESMRKVKKKR